MKRQGSTDRDYHDFIVRSGGTFILGLITDGFSRLAGRPTRRSKIGSLWRRHFAHLLRRRPITVLTNSHYIRDEGGCSRALMTMYAISYCRKFGIPYRHTPFTGVHHAERGQEEWDRNWEEFFNLGTGEVPAAGRESETFDLFLLTFLKKPGGEDLVRFVRPALPDFRPIYYFVFSELPEGKFRQLFEGMFVDLLQPMVPEFRARFRQSRPAVRNAVFTVAMHVRRGDVGPGRQDMWTDSESFSRTLASVRQALSQRGLAHRILIFSQGKQEDFAEFDGPDVEFHLDADPFWTLEQMIDSDLLVMSKSSFSYVAAMLSDGLAVYEPCQIPPLPHWIMRDGQGDLDIDVLKGRLEHYLASKDDVLPAGNAGSPSPEAITAPHP
ncbi:hypothetical protein GCM10009127_23670 [Alteraurantiacibacter aestuarii]|uniref:hypothetical protein n=1 Tax=Alteraurantiacibacter aestuarii TaxID=650004 RepID=UPI0031D00779